jgi:thiamine biosynthesis protein ThiS
MFCVTVFAGNMIKVNHLDYPFQDGMTIKTLMEEKGFVFHRIIVKLNGKVVEDANYEGTFLHDGDDVEAIHVFAGG